MSSTIVLTIKSPESVADLDLELRLGADKPAEGINAVESLIHLIRSHRNGETLSVQTGSGAPVAAATGGTITLASFVAADTIRIGNVVLTASDTPANESEFDASGANSADATALAACINAHSVLSEIITATALNAVVTIRCRIAGVISNAIYVVASAHATVVQMSGGTGGAKNAAQVYTLGA